MTHPDNHINETQAKFLEACSPDERRLHELLFKVGNATYRYYQQASVSGLSEGMWAEWIEGLQEPVKSHMNKLGFDGCKGILPFLRYVNERNDIGLEKYLEENLSEKDYEEYKRLF